jgi:hypothetical protein
MDRCRQVGGEVRRFFSEVRGATTTAHDRQVRAFGKAGWIAGADCLREMQSQNNPVASVCAADRSRQFDQLNSDQPAASNMIEDGFAFDF